MFRLLIAGGGTGGHLFPALGVAEEFIRRDADTEVLFVGTGRPVERRILEPRGFSSRKITVAGLMGKSLRDRLISLAKLPVGMIQSAFILLDFKPNLVFSVGGYASGPVGMAARLFGFNLALHEQNSIPGLTNRLLGRLAGLIFISFESARSFFPPHKTHLTGNPVRPEIERVGEAEKTGPCGVLNLFVMGGSQGAHAINEAMVEAVRILSRQGVEVSITHQTGTADRDRVARAYQDTKLSCEVMDFIQDIIQSYEKADLIVSRAGALTVSEVAASGRAAIFIPLPAADNHQEKNAMMLVEAGAAEVIRQSDLTPELLAEKITDYVNDRETVRGMGRKARQAARLNAAREIARICLDRWGNETKE
ncbi:MAG: undecaprenyldiphospho-muramoylpentapeptide beta-N-acetylglucosaminyltransferase [Deltaproteobacteria bacterium]|nr:undecaprenyldiphospho-muramoylpentapeptide beta-N-acetylglucosaminyltransferase [Deltaproteobacteria bacterium]